MYTYTSQAHGILSTPLITLKLPETNYPYNISKITEKRKKRYVDSTKSLDPLTDSSNTTDQSSPVALSFPQGLRPSVIRSHMANMHCVNITAMQVKIYASHRAADSVKNRAVGNSMYHCILGRFLPLCAGTTRRKRAGTKRNENEGTTGFALSREGSDAVFLKIRYYHALYTYTVQA